MEQYEQIIPQEIEINRMLKKKSKGSFWKGVVVGLVIAVVVSAVAFLVMNLYLVYKYGSNAPTVKSEDVPSVVDEHVMQKLQVVESVIRDAYYQEDLSEIDMESGIYRGMVNSLGDPYSTYYSAEELADILDSTEGIYYGIGAVLTLDEDSGFGIIKEVLPGTPAEESGLKDGDLIYQVDGVSTYGLDLQEIVSHVRGEDGTVVTLTIVREGENDYLKIEVTRRELEDNTVNATMYDNKIGYIQITEFDDVTTSQFEEGLKTLKSDGMQALIIDLRSNPGGNLTSVTEIARMILPEGMIVYTEDREGNRSEYTCDGKNELSMPLVVMINGASASASEILAGAVKDYEIGTLLGTKTFGKGIVQRIISLSDGSAVKLTVSSYFTPNGNNIHGIGIEPDVECIFNGEAYYENGYDNQLERARELLSEELGVEYVAPENAP